MRSKAKLPRSRRFAIISAMIVVAAMAAFQTILIFRNVDAHRDASHIIAITGAQRARVQEIAYLALGIGIGSAEPHADRRIEQLIADMVTARRKVKREPSFIVGSEMNKNVVFSTLIDGYLANVRRLERDPRDGRTLAALRRDRLEVLVQFDVVTAGRVEIADNENRHLVRGLFAGLILQISIIVGLWFSFVAPSERRSNALFAELDVLANSDSLTHLANRAYFVRALAKTVERGIPFALHYVDLDKFKIVNDGHGHPTGDLVLQIVAGRLRTCTRSEDVVARLGGDEFAVIQVGPIDHQRATLLGQRIVDALSDPLLVEDHLHQVGASVGVALYPLHGKTPSALANAADRGLYVSKKSGGGRYTVLGTVGLHARTSSLRTEGNDTFSRLMATAHADD